MNVIGKEFQSCWDQCESMIMNNQYKLYYALVMKHSNQVKKMEFERMKQCPDIYSFKRTDATTTGMECILYKDIIIKSFISHIQTLCNQDIDVKLSIHNVTVIEMKSIDNINMARIVLNKVLELLECKLIDSIQ